MRDDDLWVPADAVASSSQQRTRWAIEIMAQSMRAETRPTRECSIRQWTAETMS
ncbi:hypothetical protein [Sphingomonas sp. PAMC 26605]|uniref:hypothetical protein n=1 Tax=Sphingomonas sp. PAMC 26605 TaxID=1112214 RepID=UPI00031BC069|nr:hypothetical protein [Sphingomonas sp. PAMC 26605]